MGIGDFFRRLVHAEPAKTPWSDASDEALDQVWRARETMGRRTRNGVRDELVRRRRPLPFAEVPTIYGPAAMGLDEVLDEEHLQAWLREHDVFTREPSTVRVARASALIPSGPQTALLVVFPTWDGADLDAVQPPALLPGERVEAIVWMDAHEPEVDQAQAALGAEGVPVHGATDLGEALRVGNLQVRPIEAEAPAVEVMDDADTFRVLLGARVPVAEMAGPPAVTHVIGGFRTPMTEADGKALAEAEWELADVSDVEGVTLLADVAGTEGSASQAVGMALSLPMRALGRGLPVRAATQPLLDAVLREDRVAIAEALRGGEEAATREALDYLCVEGRLDAAEQLLAQAAEAGELSASLEFQRGLVAELAGRREEARQAWEAAARPRVRPAAQAEGAEAAEGAEDAQGAGAAEGAEGVEGAEAAEGGEGAEVVPEADPPHARASCQLAWLAAQDGDIESALGLAAAGAELAGEDALAHANHALATWLSGDAEGAFAIVQETQLASRSWLGTLLEATVHDGVPETDGFGLLSPAGFHLGPYVAGLEYLRAGALAEGERLLRRCLELEPRHPAALGQLTLHLGRAGRTDEALSLASRGLELMPHFAYLRAIRAGLLLDGGRDAEAAEELRRCLDAHNDVEDWRLNLVLAFTRLGRGDAAAAEIDALDSGGTDRVLVTELRRML